MMIGATVICRRLRQPVSRKREIVIPPPSTNTTDNPRSTQRGADRRNIERAADARNAKDFAPMRLAPAVAMLLCGNDQCRSRVLAKDLIPARQTQLRIDDYP